MCKTEFQVSAGTCGDEFADTLMTGSIAGSLRNGISKNTANRTNGRKEVKSSKDDKRKIKWLKRHSPYLILGGIVLASFLAGFLIAALTVGSHAIDTPCETLQQESVIPTESPSDHIETTDLVAALSEQSTTSEESIAAEEIEYLDIPLPTELQDYIRDLCNAYDVPFELVIALIDVESSFRPGVVSKTNDYGYMQINICNHEWLSEELGIADFLDPKQNILAGVYILSSHLEATNGDPVTALVRYNCGVAGAKRLWAQGIYSTSYTDKVMAAYEAYKK